MNCEDFMSAVDARLGREGIPARENLPGEMVRHLEACKECAEYFEEIGAIHRLLMKMEREEIPGGLRESLMQLAKSGDGESLTARMKEIAPRVVKLSVPALLIWIVAGFLTPGSLPVVETLLLLLGLVRMIEKLGRRMITDRV